ncbi:protein DGCR6-like [Dermacentor silvarum]|uniref:protein DGCR6-like n=1 Tax=Dermacentor silvarum TaxID=543639 RepID=UPI00189A5F50|nr:protein DGCR6-like [Dermacentor silvarum]
MRLMNNYLTHSGPLSCAGASASNVGLTNVLTDDLAKKERLQQRHYALFSELQQMAKDVPLSCQQRLPYELLSSLANSLLDGTVIDIVRGLKDIQMMEEQSLMETRRTVLKSHAETKAELLRRQREQKEALLLAGGQSPDFIDMAQEKETKALDQMHKDELTRVDMRIITQLDQLVSEQQVVLEKAGVPGFFVTNSPMEISIQMQLLMFITRVADSPLFTSSL